VAAGPLRVNPRRAAERPLRTVADAVLTHFGVDFALLSGLSNDEHREVLAGARRRRFARREVLFHEGDPADAVHLVVSGHVGVRVTTPLGDTATLRVVGPGEFIGELALLASAERNATAAAIEHAETLSIHRTQFEAIRRRSPRAQEALAAALAAEVRRLAAALVEAMYLPVEERFWRRVLEMATTFGGAGSSSPIPLTQEELAQLAGASRPTVNRLLGEAQAASAVLLRRGSLVVTDPEWVRRRAAVRASTGVLGGER
jgi:CRP/FNR family transcriptional regulator, cyclic AMP receptor protein